MKPACMTDEEYAEWCVLNERLQVGYRAPSPCFDCGEVFYAEMLRARSCDGTPGVIPHRPRKLTTEEVWASRRERWRRHKARQRARVLR